MADQTRTPETQRRNSPESEISKPTINHPIASPTKNHNNNNNNNNINHSSNNNHIFSHQHNHNNPISPNLHSPVHTPHNTTAASHLTQSAPAILTHTPSTTPNLRSSTEFSIPKLSPAILHELLESPITEKDFNSKKTSTAPTTPLVNNNSNNHNNTNSNGNTNNNSKSHHVSPSHSHHDPNKEHKPTPKTHHHTGTEATISPQNSPMLKSETHSLKSEISPMLLNHQLHHQQQQQQQLHSEQQLHLQLSPENLMIDQTHKPSILTYKTHHANVKSNGNDSDWDLAPFNQDHTITFPESSYSAAIPSLMRKTNGASSMSTNPITNQTLANQQQHTHQQPHNVFNNSASEPCNQSTCENLESNSNNSSNSDLSLSRYQSTGSLSARGAVEITTEQAELLKCFIPQEISRRLDIDQHGWIFSELRTISVLFIRINDKKLNHPNGPTVDDLASFFGTVASLVSSLDGSIRQFLQDDKGIVCICVFGLIAHEDDELRAIHVRRERERERECVCVCVCDWERELNFSV